MVKKILEAIKVAGTLYYFDPDTFGTVEPGEPCINMNGDGAGHLLATVKEYQPATAGAMYKIWASSDPARRHLIISKEDTLEFDANPYGLVEVEIDTRDKITGPVKGFMIDNPRMGLPMSYSGYIRTLVKHRGLHMPFTVFDVDPNTTAYKFLSEGGFSLLDNGHHIFVIDRIGYRFPAQFPVVSHSLTMDALLKHMAAGQLKVRSKVPVNGALSDIGTVQEVKILNDKNKGCGVKFSGLNYNTWFHDSDGTDKRTKYMRDLELIVFTEEKL